MTIKLQIKNVYGQERIFPACPVSEKLIRLTGRKTFYKSDIEIIKELGFEVEYVAAVL